MNNILHSHFTNRVIPHNHYHKSFNYAFYKVSCTYLLHTTTLYLKMIRDNRSELLNYINILEIQAIL